MSEPNPANPDPTSPYPIYQPYAQNPWGEQAPQPLPSLQPSSADETTSSIHPVAAQQKSTLWLWLTFAAVILILCGGTVAGFYVLADMDTTTSGSPAPAPQSASPSPAAAIKLTAPAKLAGYPKITKDRRSQQIEADMHKAISSSGLAEQVVTGVYGNLSKHQLRVFVAVKMSIPQPDDFIKGTADSLGKDLGIKRVVTVPAGPLGGEARCGDTRKDGRPLTMCVWADHASFGIVVFFGQQVSAAKATFVQARGQIESMA